MHKGLNPAWALNVLFLFLIRRIAAVLFWSVLAAEHVLYISEAGVSAGDAAAVVYHESIARIRSVK